jgi:hypothetical protein
VVRSAARQNDRERQRSRNGRMSDIFKCQEVLKRRMVCEAAPSQTGAMTMSRSTEMSCAAEASIHPASKR